jgi:2-polyprenyl-6-methoxyphenol hydroxylase-like FAD-dependent oxidoreductase
MHNREVFIIGAGSTGLSAAFFLSAQGFKTSITDKRQERRKITKALGINPGTLKIFEGTGVTEKFLQNGWKCGAMNFWSNGKHLFKNDFSKIRHEYPFMLIQPQHETESIIEEMLGDRGIFIERGKALENIVTGDTTVMTFSDGQNRSEQIETAGIVIGADGSKSKVREKLGVAFNGWEHREEFTLYDVEMETPLTHKEGHYYFFREGGMILLHIRDGVWRVGGNVKNVFDHLPKGTRTGKISWETTFTIREKVAASFRTNNVYLLGDAAHIHSPAGAKGMNMCIEDSFIFSNLFRDNREREYHDQRYPSIKRSVGILGQLTDKIGGNNWMGRNIRSNMGAFSFLSPLVMPPLRRFLLGLK